MSRYWLTYYRLFIGYVGVHNPWWLHGFTDIARLLLDHGAYVNWIDGEGVTPLILASFKDHIELVQLLLDYGADITVHDQWNQTALDYALRRGESDPTVQLLKSSN